MGNILHILGADIFNIDIELLDAINGAVYNVPLDANLHAISVNFD